MKWEVKFQDDFEKEFDELSQEVQDEIYVYAEYLEEFGSSLKRPHADTLKGSKLSNLKELRFKADGGVWRVLYAFDPERCAILLIAGDKSGVSEQRFYRDIIKKAEKRYSKHLKTLKVNTITTKR